MIPFSPPSRNGLEPVPRHPQRLHRDLRAALEHLRAAEQSAVTLFARVLHERAYRRLGYATIELYAGQGLGLSEAKTRQFLRLARALDDLPATRATLDAGRLSWTKARTLTAVATPRTEGHWVEAAAVVTSRELEQKVKQARARQKRERERLRGKRGQAALLLDTPRPAAAPATQAPPAPVEVPVTVSVTLSPVQAARFEALLETLRKRGDHRPRASLLLDGLAALAAGHGTRDTGAAPYHVVAYRCEACNNVHVGGRAVALAAAAAMECDSIRISQDPRIPNRSSIPPAVRRAVLARDGHRCTVEGCHATHFLEVHHIVPRARGGSNALENLTTLCGACHRFHHEREGAP